MQDRNKPVSRAQTMLLHRCLHGTLVQTAIPAQSGSLAPPIHAPREPKQVRSSKTGRLAGRQSQERGTCLPCGCTSQRACSSGCPLRTISTTLGQLLQRPSRDSWKSSKPATSSGPVAALAFMGMRQSAWIGTTESLAVAVPAKAAVRSCPDERERPTGVLRLEWLLLEADIAAVPIQRAKSSRRALRRRCCSAGPASEPRAVYGGAKSSCV